jgi:nucleoside-diphosphate-sugar epimerase
MKILVTGSSGHLGEALIRTLIILQPEHEIIGIDILDSSYTTHVGTIVDRDFVKNCMNDVKIVYHTATLHKPHVSSHSKQNFIDVNITGTLNLLEEATLVGVTSFIFTSTTSVFGDSLIPPIESPATYITEDIIPIPKNIYGVTKFAAEDLCVY